MATSELITGAEDLTGKARIRNAAMQLFATRGADATSMRAIADSAGVTVGLLVHHFRTKDGIRDAVDELVVDYFSQAIDTVPVGGSPAKFAAARDAAVRQMLGANPVIVDYLRRTILDPVQGPSLLGRLADLTHREVVKFRRKSGTVTDKPESAQVIGVMMQQLGQLFLQPMVDTMWNHLNQAGVPGTVKPTLRVSTTH